MKPQLNRLITLLVISACLLSCAKIKVNTPSPRFITPEAQGKLFSGSGRLEQTTGTEGTIDFSGDRLDNPMELRNNVSSPSVSLDLGVVENLDFIIKGSSNTPTVYTLKYQFLGDNRMSASKGNKSLAVTFGYGYQVQSQTDSDSNVFDDSNKNLEAELEQSIMEASVIYGFRTHKDTLVYASVQATKQDINFELDSSDNTNLDGKSFTLNTWAYGTSAGAVRYFEKYYLNLEVSAQKTDWNNNNPMTYAFVNLALGYKWE